MEFQFPALSVVDLGVFAVLSLPHLLYAYVWTNANSFKRFVNSSSFFKRLVEITRSKSTKKRTSLSDRAVISFEYLAHFLKIVQLSAISFWTYSKFPTRGLADADFTSVPVYVYTGALFSLAMGQVLNIAIYRAIGVNGVYYGVRLGNPVPWCKGFPFNVVSHPQYVGATLSFLGLSALLAYLIDPSAWYIAAFMAFCYICTGYIEDTY